MEDDICKKSKLTDKDLRGTSSFNQLESFNRESSYKSRRKKHFDKNL